MLTLICNSFDKFEKASDVALKRSAVQFLPGNRIVTLIGTTEPIYEEKTNLIALPYSYIPQEQSYKYPASYRTIRSFVQNKQKQI